MANLPLPTASTEDLRLKAPYLLVRVLSIYWTNWERFAILGVGKDALAD